MSLGWGLFRAAWFADKAFKYSRIAAADERRYNQRRRAGDEKFGRRADDYPRQLKPIHNSYAVHLFWIVVLCALVFGLSWRLGLELQPFHLFR